MASHSAENKDAGRGGRLATGASSVELQGENQHVVLGGRHSATEMQEAHKANEAKLHEQSGQTSGAQSELQRRVTEQRSENENKINESAEEIGKNRSTVQTSSDILKGELSNAQGKFAAGYENEKGQQKFISQEADDADVKAKLAEIRKRAG